MIRLNKSIKILLFALACMAFSANAQQTVIDGVIYQYGEIQGCTDNLPAHLVIPDSITIDGKKFKVSMRFASLFENKQQLESVEIHTSLVPVRCFWGCKNLKSVELKGENIILGELAFAYSGIEKIDLTNVTRIDNLPFKGCDKLTTLTLPKKHIVTYFRGSTPNIKTVEYDKNVYTTSELRSMFRNTAFEESLPAAKRKPNQAGKNDKRYKTNKKGKTITY